MSYKNVELPELPTQLVFALDYDDCFTEDKRFWADFFELISRYGHKLVILTSRRDKNMSEVQYAFRFEKIKVYNTNQQPKLDFVQENNIHIDIWIDNDPRTITGDFS